ncbi:sugar ABC transporter permease [Thermoclostridium stercorarium subsp. leptospartum DSM 9219]|uniref:Sugar ABC transporter permease n=1 Tax=Thermoclostridium stercorarium subsp. leptospartum DSM 9219 TaxID=1346611 RepID=A0A1B1YP38_THEST|nr:carbohydrate ABC transporter permease [Thermoclostridium stercorarium]ANX02502.1 sugar ABC transporter permease [Thermoclostridium stercorarium subsp. leptospartum DSM 9219]
MVRTANKNKIKESLSDRIFNVVNVTLLILLVIACFYPFWHVICASFSKPSLFMSHSGVLLKPVGFSLASYKKVFENSSIWRGYLNTLYYVVVGTALNIVMTVIGAYFLSRKNIPGQKAITIFIMFTMYFSGGMIPAFLNIQSLGLYNTRAALILPSAINTFNLIVMRTAMASVDDSLEESARLDGASHITILVKIILPLTRATVAVLVLYYGVAHWNSWFPAMIYIEDKSKEPLQLVLRQILIVNDMSEMGIGEDQELISETIKHATIVVSTVPILCLYPFLQKYFTKGMMIGAVKG